MVFDIHTSQKEVLLLIAFSSNEGSGESAQQLKLPQPILWNQTTDVHQGSTLING